MIKLPRHSTALLALVALAATLAGCSAAGGNSGRTDDPTEPGAPPAALIAGTVFDEATGVGIPNAVVSIAELEGAECTTDARGCFSLGKVALPDMFTIEFSADYYGTARSVINTDVFSQLRRWEYWFAVGLAMGHATTQGSVSIVRRQNTW